MQSHSAKNLWLSAFVLMITVMWLGCEQKGDVSPTGSSRQVLTFIDTVLVDPFHLTPGATATVEARVLTESNDPAINEEIRFSVNRGALAGNQATTMVSTDSLGRARTTYTAPMDTGSFLLRTELPSMSELRTTSLFVTEEQGQTEGLLNVWAGVDTLYADNGTSSTTIYARLRNSQHNPIGGATIYFSTTLGSVTSPAVTDQVSGTAIATLVTSTETGLSTVIARYGDTSDTVRVRFLEPAQASIVVLSASKTQMNAGNDSCTVTARVFDSNMQPVGDNTVVFFAADHGTLSQLSSNTIHGIATTTLYASTESGETIISASCGSNVNGSTSVNVMAGPPAQIVVTSTTFSMFADNISVAPMIADVMDAFGNPVSQGTPISWSAVGGTVTASSSVDPNGQALATFQAGLDVGPATITAMNGTVQGNATIPLVGTEPMSMNFTANPMQLTADGSSTSELRVLVLDENNQPVSNGTSVTFTSHSGQIAGVSGTNNFKGDRKDVKNPWQSANKVSTDNPSIVSLKSESGYKSDPRTFSTYSTTTEAGYAYANLTSPIEAGEDSVSARAGEIYAWQELSYVAGQAAQIQVNPGQSELPGDGISSTTITCRVADAFGNTVGAGVGITLDASRGELIPAEGYTNDQGMFVTNLVSSRDRGICAIVATAGPAAGYGEVRFMAPEVSEVRLQAGQSTLYANGISSTVLTAWATDSYGLPIDDAPVMWQLEAGIGRIEPVTIYTDSLGRSSAQYFTGASESDEEQTITVSIDDVPAQLTINMLGVTISCWSDDESLPADGEAQTLVNALVRETTSGVAIVGGAVRFAATSGSISQTILTDQSGVASATYRASNESGQVSVNCSYGSELRATTSFQLTSTDPSEVILSISNNSILANGVSTVDVSAHVMNESGQSMPNTLVTMGVNGPGSILNSELMTNDTGWVFTTYRSAAHVNDAQATITAAIDRSEQESVVQLRGVSVSISTDDSSIPANGMASTQVQAVVRETTNLVGVVGVPVMFGTSLGSLPASAPTNSSGIASVSLQSSSSAGNAQVIALYGDLLSDTMWVEMYQATASVVQLNSSENSLRADGYSGTDLTARVFDEQGVPLGNIPVSWSTTAGSIQNAETMTNSAGWVNAEFTSSASNVNVSATISVNAGTAQSSFVMNQRGVTVNVVAVPNQVIADGSSSSEIRAHIFETSNNFPVTGVEVQFGTTLGTIVGLTTSDDAGVASVPLTSSVQTGIANVTATFGNALTNMVQVTFAPSTPTTLSLTATPTVLLADNQSNSSLTAVVTDQNGNPVPNGTQVRFSIPPTSGSLENLRTTFGGVANNTLTSSTTPGNLWVTAWAETNPSVRDSVYVTYVVGAPAVVTISMQTDTLRADGIATDSVTAYVTDAVGHPLPNVEVRFSATIGNITSSTSTDESGNARVAFSSSQTGTTTIRAVADSASDNHTVYLIPGGPNSIQMEYNPGSVGVRGSGRNETLLVTATVRDLNNNPVIDGTPVYFNINNSPGGGDFLSSGGPIPTINGRATVSYNSGTVSGTARVRALCDLISSVSTEILIYAGPPYIENIFEGCATSHMSCASSPCNMYGMDVVGDSVMVLALVGDRYNNPVTPGTAVYFTTSGGVITTATGYTDSMGFARVTLWSGNPLPTVSRWLSTLSDPNIGGPILCTEIPTQAGVAKVLASSAGVDGNGDSVTVWSSTNVTFNYSEPLLYLREASVGGDPENRELFIGENALIRFATYDYDYWPLVSGSVVRFTSNEGTVYPSEITIGCPGDTTYTVSFFNNLTLEDTDAASPVLIEVETERGGAYTFTETFTLRAALPN